MATYKKRGHKPKTKAEKISKIEDESTTAEVFSKLDEGASRTEAFVEKNQKIILTTVIVVALGVLGYLGYAEYIQKPNEISAKNDMFQAQSHFEQALTATNADSLYNLSLNGIGGRYGFIKIADNYGGTDAGNLSRYYAGMAYLNTNKYEKAIEYLRDFKSDDAIIAPLVNGNIGDAYAALNDNKEALNSYKKAASLSDNEFTTPKYLLKAGITAISLGNTSEALSLLNQIKDKYPNVAEATQADMYIGKAEAMQ